MSGMENIVGATGGIPDWESFLRRHAQTVGAELELDGLRPGDLLVVTTQNTTYQLKIIEGREAELSTRRSDRPGGKVRIHGCTFGQSSSIKPGHLFCGGSLEIAFDSGQTVHNTTSIKEIHVVRRNS